MRKWIYIGLAFAFLATVLLIAKCNDEAEVVVQDEFVPKKEQTIEVAKRNTLDSIALQRANDSIEILNNMIANNVKQVKYIKVKSNEKAPRTKLLDSRQTRRHPERDTRHGRTMDIQIQTGRDRSPLQGLSSQPLCSKGLHPNQERSLLRKLCPRSIFRHTPPSLVVKFRLGGAVCLVTVTRRARP